MEQAASTQSAAFFCSGCGTAYKPEDRFCQRCGEARFSAVAAAQAAPKPPSQAKSLLLTVAPFLAIIAVAAGLIYAFNVATEVHADPLPEAPLIARAEKEVSDSMKDPGSADFRNVIGSIEDQCVMGEVQGKNGFGALAGYQGFVWHKGLILFDDGSVFGAYFNHRHKCLDNKMAKEMAGLKNKRPS